MGGLAFLESGQLVFAETHRQRLWIGEWNAATAVLTNERVWLDLPATKDSIGPDGMTLSSDGNLYVAVYGSHRIHIIHPFGKPIGEITFDGPHPNNCVFDPRNPNRLIVTEAGNGEILEVLLN